MKRYSASEAIWPALERSYAYLFRSFKVETFFKLAAMATLCEGFLVSFQFAVPNIRPIDTSAAQLRALLLTPGAIAVTLLVAAAGFFALVYGFYLVTRLRFAFFHSLVHETRQIRPAWKLYAMEAERLFAASVVVWLSFLVAAVLAFITLFVAAWSADKATGGPDPFRSLFLFFPCLVIAVLLIVAASFAQVVLNDFILPHMAIESVSFLAAWSIVRARMTANRESFTAYFLIRLGMPLAAGLLLAGVGWLAGTLVFGLLGISAAGFAAMMSGAGAVREYLRMVIEWIFAGLGLGAGASVAVCLAGPLGVFVRTYALLFYGGYYPALGNLLEPPRV